MASAIRIRNMRLEDHPFVLELWKRSRGVGVDKDDSRRSIRAYFARNPGMSFVACAGRRVVGAVLCGHEGRRGYLNHLAVDGKFRKRGIGRLLVERCLENLGRLDIRKCNAFLFSANREGLRFWRRVGWKVRRDILLLQKVVRPAKSGRRR